MVLVDITMLSGFIPDQESLKKVSNCNFKTFTLFCSQLSRAKFTDNQFNLLGSLQLKKALLVDRVEQTKDHVIMYFKEVRDQFTPHYFCSLLYCSLQITPLKVKDLTK